MRAIKVRLNVANSIKYFSTNRIPKPQINPKLPNTKLFLDNKWVDSLEQGNSFSVINPSNGKVITEIQSSCQEDINRAVESAKKAFHHNSPWRRMDSSDRCKLLIKFAELIERDAAYIASLEALDVGKLYPATYEGDVLLGAKYARYSAGWTDKFSGQVIAEDGNLFSYTRYEPVGVCGMISAWNFSTLMNCVKIFHSLTTGNVALVKPSQHATLPILHLIELSKEAGFPPGVISLLPGKSEVGGMMTDHPEIDLISFTGSTEAGQDVQRRAAVNIKKLILMLGGKSPCVVFDDVDLDAAVKGAHNAVFFNAGQCCCSASRTYVQETIYEEFLKRSIKLANAKVIGDPFHPETMQGPQANESHLNSILNMIKIGKEEGATIVAGGNRCDREGFFMEPTIFTDINDDMTIVKEEIFGPVQMIIPFKTMDEVIEKANNSKYGLAAGLFTNDVNKINTFSQCVRAGNVWVNTYFEVSSSAPFGGYKMSGIQKEGGHAENLTEDVQVS